MQKSYASLRKGTARSYAESGRGPKSPKKPYVLRHLTHGQGSYAKVLRSLTHGLMHLTQRDFGSYGLQKRAPNLVVCIFVGNAWNSRYYVRGLAMYATASESRL